LLKIAKHKALQVNGVKLNHAIRQVSCHNQLIELTGTEYQIIEHLMSKPRGIVSNIRRKLLPFSPSDKLKTIRGAGYIFLTGELN
jgi:two-component system response regulator CpxR